MKIINLSGVVGWEITDRLVSNLLPKNNTEDVEVHINSYGGDAFEAFAIYNTLKNYAGNMTTIIKGIAASAAGIIYLAGKEKKIYKNSTFMAHPAWGFAIGEGDILISRGKMLNSVTDVILDDLSKLMSKEKAELLEELKSEIWLVGWEQIVGEGLADEVIDGDEIEKLESKNEIHAKVLNIQDKMRAEAKANNKIYEKVAASIADRFPEIVSDNKPENNPEIKTVNSPQQRDNISMEENMDKAKLKADFPDLYEEIYNEGKESVKTEANATAKNAITEDRERSAKVMKLAGVNDEIINSVKNGQTSGDYAEAELTRQREANTKALKDGDNQNLGSFTEGNQLPNDTKPETAKDAENKKEDEAFDAFIKSKKGAK